VLAVGDDMVRELDGLSCVGNERFDASDTRRQACDFG
jgi:hypothetical protein